MIREQRARLRWGCRRGMLELDCILQPFFDQHFDQMTTEQQQMFADLLHEADPDLFSWLMGYQQAPEGGLRQMVAFIREQHFLCISQ